MMTTITGLATSRGFASGPVFLYCTSGDVVIEEYKIHEDQVDAELQRFYDSRAATKCQLQELITRLEKESNTKEAEIFSSHILLYDDALIIKEVEGLIRNELVNAESAVRRGVGKFCDVFSKMNDPYLRERVRDIEDLERRTLKNLRGEELPAFANITEPVIIVADDLTPSETVMLPRDLVLGFATDHGSTTSHVALLARSLGIPAVVGLNDITKRVKPNENILLDGTNGAVTIAPDQQTIDAFNRMMAREKELFSHLENDAAHDGTMKDGTVVELCANVQAGVPLDTLAKYGAQGIGLYRSEYLWLSKDTPPTEEEQFEAYREAVEACSKLRTDAIAVIRVLDLGGDKVFSGSVNQPEINPFLGNRSTRFLLSHRTILRRQLRAILRASAYGKTAVLYPMISTVSEVREINSELLYLMEQLREEGLQFDEKIRRGVMIEVPSAALMADQLAKEVEFFSIGTNDLIQYTMAADRGNEQVAYLYQPASPAILRLVDMTVKAANAAGIPVAVCGETASDPVLGVLWVGLGVKELSMSACYIPVLKKVLCALSRSDVEELASSVRELCVDRSATEIYSFCREFLVKKVPDLAEIQAFFAAG